MLLAEHKLKPLCADAICDVSLEVKWKAKGLGQSTTSRATRVSSA